MYHQCQWWVVNFPTGGIQLSAKYLPRGDFARPISRGSSALPIVSETIDRCIILPTLNCRPQISILIPPFQKSRSYPPPPDSAAVLLLGHQRIARGFYLEKGWVPSMYERFIRHWLPKKWGKIDFFLRSVLSRETSVSKITPPPPKKKKIDFFLDWIGLFEICFRSSEMTDPRP